MKNKLMPLLDKLLLRKRALIESIGEQLKHVCQISTRVIAAPTMALPTCSPHWSHTPGRSTAPPCISILRNAPCSSPLLPEPYVELTFFYSFQSVTWSTLTLRSVISSSRFRKLSPRTSHFAHASPLLSAVPTR